MTSNNEFHKFVRGKGLNARQIKDFLDYLAKFGKFDPYALTPYTVEAYYRAWRASDSWADGGSDEF